MSLLGNIIWLIFGGLIVSVGYILGGALLCLTIVGIPFGLQAIHLGIETFAPFGKDLVTEPHANSPGRLFFNILWLVLFGWEIAVAHVLHAALLAITVIGIPFAWQHVKLVPIALLPFGRSLR